MAERVRSGTFGAISLFLFNYNRLFIAKNGLIIGGVFFVLFFLSHRHRLDRAAQFMKTRER